MYRKFPYNLITVSQFNLERYHFAGYALPRGQQAIRPNLMGPARQRPPGFKRSIIIGSYQGPIDPKADIVQSSFTQGFQMQLLGSNLLLFLHVVSGAYTPDDRIEFMKLSLVADTQQQ